MGLLVIFKIVAIIICWIHKKAFEMKMEGGDKDFKKVFSFANLDDALKEITQLRG